MTMLSKQGLLTLFVLTAYLGPWWLAGRPFGWGALVFAALLIWISIEDLDRFLVPDAASGGLVLSGAIHLVLTGTPGFTSAVAASAFWAGAFVLVAIGHRVGRGFDGLGFGDAKLMAGIGLWLGWTAAVWTVLTATLAAAVAQITLRALGRSRPDAPVPGAIAFGPFLCLSAWAFWLKGP